MPREFTHWLAAEKVAAKLNDTIYHEPISKFRNIFLLGSNFHDSLFYATKLNKKSEMALIPNILHGSEKEDTFDIIKSVVDQIVINGSNEHLIAFLVGMITHIFTDSLFHPMVFYFSGHYSRTNKKMKKANQFHHKLEALIEFYLAGEMIENRSYRLNNLMAKAEYPFDRLISEIIRGYSAQNQRSLTEAIISGYHHLSRTQTLGLDPSANFLSNLFYPILPNRLKDLISIRYDKRLLKHLPSVKNELIYKNPITGDKITNSIDDLINESVEKSVDFCKNIEKFISNKRPLILTYKGPSLKAGISDSTVKDMKYFSDKPIVM